MIFHRPVKIIPTATLVSLILSGLLLCGDGCSKKEEAGEETTAETQSQMVSPSQTSQSGEVQPAQTKEVVSVGDKVRIQYTGTLDDGTMFDQSSPGKPLVFVAGVGQVIPGFDKAVIGMKLNEEKTLTIPAEEAYGPSNPNMIRNVPRENFAEGFQGEIGDEVTLTNQGGRKINGKIRGMSPDSVLIDFNHPLAGQNLTFDIKVVGIE